MMKLRGWMWLIALLTVVSVCMPYGIAKPEAFKSNYSTAEVHQEALPTESPKKSEELSEDAFSPEIHDDQVHAPVKQEYAYGVVLSVKDAGVPKEEGMFNPIQTDGTMQLVTVRLTSGPLSGKVVTSQNMVGDNPAYNIDVQPGKRVLLNLEKTPEGEWQFYIANRDRTPAMILLGCVVLLAILVIGGRAVTKHFFLAVALLVSLYKLLFPAILDGQPVLPLTFFLCVVFTVLGSLIHQPQSSSPQQQKLFNRSHVVVIVGSLGGLLLMVGLLWGMQAITPLSGFSDEALASLWYNNQKMDFWGLYVAGCLVGYQGFLFYLVWMLAQSRNEVEDAGLTFDERFEIVLRRGGRLLGPMLSSQSLLFMGLYMPLLLQLQGMHPAQFLNLESTASLITMLLSGTLALVLAVPLTAWLVATLMGKREPAS